MSMTAEAAIWSGWWRQGTGHTWRRVRGCDAPDAATAWSRLYADKRLPSGGDFMVSPAPTRTPPRCRSEEAPGERDDRGRPPDAGAGRQGPAPGAEDSGGPQGLFAE